ncbi:hypothetical protein TNIN_500411 [Trichonephila inaurata madagascariensis]|uniref:Uncharacterized protein n=1 Tax=Trichonephila inaurata madagascariensis TaxID=2747483 RepID=A0A8X7C3R6_9ARAC|nr:hypothetical protein TNIN_500411 [Trichonephila inaurata madagascariensis]
MGASKGPVDLARVQLPPGALSWRCLGNGAGNPSNRKPLGNGLGDAFLDQIDDQVATSLGPGSITGLWARGPRAFPPDGGTQLPGGKLGDADFGRWRFVRLGAGCPNKIIFLEAPNSSAPGSAPGGGVSSYFARGIDHRATLVYREGKTAL